MLIFLGLVLAMLAPLLSATSSSFMTFMMVPFTLFGIAIMIPSLAVTVRRFHDIGRSGWWYLIVMVPYVGTMIVFVLTLFPSDPGPNEFGPNPDAPAFDVDAAADMFR